MHLVHLADISIENLQNKSEMACKNECADENENVGQQANDDDDDDE